MAANGQELRVAVTKTSAQGKRAQSATPNLMSFSTDENVMNKDFEKDLGAIIDDAAGSPSTGLPGGTSPETYGVMPLASTAVGKVLEVYASKTRAEALSLTGANPQALFFPTDAESIVFGGKEYGAGPYYIRSGLIDGLDPDIILSNLGKPSDLVAAVRARRPIIGWDGTSLYDVAELYPISVRVSSSIIYLTWTEHYRGNRIELHSAVLNFSGDAWTSCKFYDYRFTTGVYTPPAE